MVNIDNLRNYINHLPWYKKLFIPRLLSSRLNAPSPNEQEITAIFTTMTNSWLWRFCDWAVPDLKDFFQNPTQTQKPAENLLETSNLQQLPDDGNMGQARDQIVTGLVDEHPNTSVTPSSEQESSILLTQMRQGSKEEKDAAADALIKLIIHSQSNFNSTHTSIIKQGLLNLLRSENDETRSVGIQTIVDLTFYYPEQQKIFIAEEVITMMLNLLKVGNSFTKITLLEILEDLFENQPDLLRTEEVLIALLALLSDDNNLIKLLSMILITSLLFENSAFQDCFFNRGGLEAFLPLLKIDIVVVKFFAVTILARLAEENTTNQNNIRIKGGVADLLCLLNEKDTSTDIINLDSTDESLIKRLTEELLDNSISLKDAEITALILLIRNNQENLDYILTQPDLIKGCLSALVNLLNKEQDSDQIEHAVDFLEELTRNNSNIVETFFNELGDIEGGISTLLGLLKNNQHIKTKQFGVMGLYQLAKQNPQLHRIILAGTINSRNGIKTLLNLLWCFETLEYAEGLIMLLIKNNLINQEIIGNNECISTLLTQLLEELDEDKTDPNYCIIIKSHALILAEFARNNPANLNIILDEGGIPAILTLLDYADIEIKEAVIDILREFVTNDDFNQDLFRENECIPRLIDLFNNSNLAIKLLITRLFTALARDNELNKEAIRTADGITALMSLMGEQDVAIKQIAAGALMQLIWGNPENLRTVLTEERVAIILSLLTIDNLTVKQFLVVLLKDSVIHELCSPTLISHAQCIFILIVLLNDDHLEIKKVAAMALGHLATHAEENKNTIRRQKGISVLLRILKQFNQLEMTFLYTINTLTELAKSNTKNQNIIRRNKGILTLLGLMKQNEHFEIKIAAINLLRELARNNPANQNTIGSQGGVFFLLKFISSDAELFIKLHAAELLIVLLITNRTNQNMIRRYGGIPNLLTLGATQEFDAKLCVTAALLGLAENNRDNQDAIRDQNGIVFLFDILNQNDGMLKIMALKAITELARNNSENQKIIFSAENVLIFLNLVTVNEPRIQLFALLALAELIHNNPTNQNRIGIDGLQVLLNLMRESDNKEIRRKVTGIVLTVVWNNIMFQENILLNERTFLDILSLTTNSDYLTQKYATGILISLAFWHDHFGGELKSQLYDGLIQDNPVIDQQNGLDNLLKGMLFSGVFNQVYEIEEKEKGKDLRNKRDQALNSLIKAAKIETYKDTANFLIWHLEADPRIKGQLKQRNFVVNQPISALPVYSLFKKPEDYASNCQGLSFIKSDNTSQFNP